MDGFRIQASYKYCTDRVLHCNIRYAPTTATTTITTTRNREPTWIFFLPLLRMTTVAGLAATNPNIVIHTFPYRTVPYIFDMLHLPDDEHLVAFSRCWLFLKSWRSCISGCLDLRTPTLHAPPTLGSRWDDRRNDQPSRAGLKKAMWARHLQNHHRTVQYSTYT